jgi:putative transposase
MILTYCYRLLPRKDQHRALEALLEGQRQLYNAALEERIEAWRKAGVTRTYVDQCRALTEWRHSDSDAASVPVCLQRWTLKQVDEAYRGFFRRLKAGGAPGFPRFRGKGRFDSFGFREFSGIRLENGRIRFKGLPGGLRVHLHRPLPPDVPIRSCVFRRDVKGWKVGFSVGEPSVSISESRPLPRSPMAASSRA